MKYNKTKYLEMLKANGLVTDYNIKSPDTVEYISYNSRDIKENTLFVCKGAHFKKEYLKSSLESGASIYVSCEKYTDEADYIIVSDIRRAIALIANLYYENIWNKLNLIGITGTKGKSTNAYFIKYILDEYLTSENKALSGIISSIDTYDGVSLEESHLTTPEQFELQKHFYNSVSTEISHMTMEVSSQALKYDRVFGINYKVGCFLNIGSDHISDVEHPDEEDYFYSKMILFSQTENAVINLDCKRAGEALEFAKKCRNTVTFSTRDKNADVYGYDIRKTGNDTTFTVKTKDFEKDFVLTIPGLFNVENALAAIAVATVLGIPEQFIYVGLMKARSSGRMEIYENCDNSIITIVDYAHNKMSFETLFDSVKKEFPGRKISIVFGCPGKKAFQRRKDLGEIAGRFADKTYITEEDSGEEPTLDIAKEIASYVKKENGGYEIIEDRGEAIRKAIFETGENSVILITGKGNETRMKRGTEYIPTPSDVDYVLKYLKEYDVFKKKDCSVILESKELLCDALSSYKGERIIVKLGGSVMEKEELTENILEGISTLKKAGAELIVVHGGGKNISSALNRFGIKSKFKNGYRITGDEEIEIVEMVLSGQVNKKITGILNLKGVNAAGISGKDGKLFLADKKLIANEDIGKVGEIKKVSLELINSLLRSGFVPVVSPVSADESGNTYNVNADDAAFSLAEEMKADKLIFITDVNGIMIDANNSKTTLEEIDINKAEMLIENGFIGGGMIPKLHNCTVAIKNGVKEVLILNGTEKNSLLSAFVSDKKNGTTIKE